MASSNSNSNGGFSFSDSENNSAKPAVPSRERLKIFIEAKPGAKENSVEKTGNNRFKVSVKEPPFQGRANVAIVKEMANHLGIDRSRVKIIGGATSRFKTLEII